jgi:hypothetical protein
MLIGHRRAHLIAIITFVIVISEIASGSENSTMRADDQVIHQCTVAAASLNFDSSRYYRLCINAINAATRQAAISNDAASRDEYRLKEAASELSAAGAAFELGNKSAARALLVQSRSLFTSLSENGASAYLRSTSRQYLACFFQGDKDASRSLAQSKH